jgi:hypothetical protein
LPGRRDTHAFDTDRGKHSPITVAFPIGFDVLDVGRDRLGESVCARASLFTLVPLCCLASWVATDSADPAPGVHGVLRQGGHQRQRAGQ